MSFVQLLFATLKGEKIISVHRLQRCEAVHAHTLPLQRCCQALGMCTLFTSQHCQGNVDGNSSTQQQHGNRLALWHIFILLWDFFNFCLWLLL